MKTPEEIKKGLRFCFGMSLNATATTARISMVRYNQLENHLGNVTKMVAAPKGKEK